MESIYCHHKSNILGYTLVTSSYSHILMTTFLLLLLAILFTILADLSIIKDIVSSYSASTNKSKIGFIVLVLLILLIYVMMLADINNLYKFFSK